MENYHPTVWRTCRILANERRLAALKAVLTGPGGSVGELAALARLSVSQASLCLRALQARGLVVAKRESRWVHYFPQPDPLVAAAAPILAGLAHALLKQKRAKKEIVHCLTAFTHPRRLVILRRLQQAGAVPVEALSRKSQISLPALYRHLKKLLKRGLVLEEAAGWSLCPKQEPLADTFLTLLAVSPE